MTKFVMTDLPAGHPAQKAGATINVQAMVNVDGSEDYFYCGSGKFCKNRKEADQWIMDYLKGKV